jgi:hypothetical protein
MVQAFGVCTRCAMLASTVRWVDISVVLDSSKHSIMTHANKSVSWKSAQDTARISLSLPLSLSFTHTHTHTFAKLNMHMHACVCTHPHI